MKKFNILLASALTATASTWAANKPAEQLATAAFKNPAVAFQSRLILTEWNGSDSHAEELNLFYSPPDNYRIEFLGFDGTVKKVVIQNGSQKASPLDYAPLFADVLSNAGMDALLKKNYKFTIKGSENFIGRAVWVLEIVPQAKGKPQHELKIDKETLVVLEHRRFLPNDKIGSLTRFSTFEPNRTFAADTFVPAKGISTEKKDVEIIQPTDVKPPSPAMKDLPAGFSLSSYNVFEVEGTQANHFYYSDGALPLSVFETTLPIHFPERASASDKMEFMIVPTYGISSVDQVAYGKRHGKYITVIGEVSPSLLQTIVHRFD